MDSEEVVAYIHNIKLWHDMDNEEKKAWQIRVCYVLTLKDENGKQWSQRRLAPLLGITESALRGRLAWSEPQEVRKGRSQATQRREQRAGKRYIREHPEEVRQELEKLDTKLSPQPKERDQHDILMDSIKHLRKVKTLALLLTEQSLQENFISELDKFRQDMAIDYGMAFDIEEVEAYINEH